MRGLLCVLLAAAYVLADDSENRRSKLPYISDAVGNTLPPPSNGPATVGSPVNLLTPDRYEFYTFDESGELVKRLMTLEEIQAIVAAGEETEGLVTFANENQPTVAFNFSQPPYNKVHNVVTNVQNVLKAQMEAHKNKPLTQPTLDTPDVSDSWSLILPSIFGNTGVDIVPDKTSATFTTPETETIDIDRPMDDNSLSKEGNNQILSSSSTTAKEELKKVAVTEKNTVTTEKIKAEPTTISTTTTTREPTTTTTAKPLSTTTTTKPTTPKSTTTTVKPTATTNKLTTVKLRTTTSTTTSRPRTTSTTSKPRTTTTIKPTTKVVKTTPKLTTIKPNPTTKKTLTTSKINDGNFTRIQLQTQPNTVSTTEKSTIQYERISTYIPLSTAAFVTERSTQKPLQTTKQPASSTTKKIVPTTMKAPLTTVRVLPSVSTPNSVSNLPMSTLASTAASNEVGKYNATTVTTQSVSPSTTVSSTEFISVGQHSHSVQKKPVPNNNIKHNESNVPMFDVDQSISQIASDLANFGPLPTSSELLLDTTKNNDMNLESKENVEIDIPIENEKVLEKVIVQKEAEGKDPNVDNFVKISTIEPHNQNENTVIMKDPYSKIQSSHTPMTTTTTKTTTMMTTTAMPKVEFSSSVSVTTTIDPVLSESMDDLLSQIVNQAPQSIVNPENRPNNDLKVSTTEIPVTAIKNEKPTKEEALSTTSAAPEVKLPSKIKEKITESQNATNEIPQIQIETRISDTKKENMKPDKEHERIETIEPSKEGENKQNLVQISEFNTKQKENFEVSTQSNATKHNENKTLTENKNDNKDKIISAQKINDTNEKNKNNNVKENNDISETIVIKNVPENNDVPKKNENKPINNFKKQEAILKTTTTTELPKKSETIKKPASFVEPAKKPTMPVKKPENNLSNPDKIVVQNNKIDNEKDRAPPESSLPKVDEFKKKIQKVNIDDKELANERNSSWKLISTVSPPKANDIPNNKHKTDVQDNTNIKDIILDFSKENQGLEVTTKDLSEDIAQFTELCNELAFRYWHAMTENIDKKRSFVLSPYSVTSMLAMMFMGARGATSGEMNEILKLDDMVTFNPHFTLKNISDSIETTSASGVIVSAFVRELFSDRSRGKVLTFYKERAQHFYNGHVEEVNFKLISDIIRRRTNLLVKRYTWGRIAEYMKANTITMQPPLAAFSANIFQTDCSGSSVEGRDGEMYFVVSPNVRQRRLVPVPAVVYRNGFLAGYDPVLDATAAALGNTNSIISTLFLMPGQQGNVVHADDLEALEKRLLDSNPTTPAWNRLLRTLLPRIGLELQIPRFSHKSLFNVSTTLKKMGLKELFDPEHADLGGLNGPSKDLYLSDMVQSTTFVTCGEEAIGEQHHIEEYPDNLPGPQRRRTSRWATGWDEPRDYQRAFHDPHDVGDAMHLPLHLRPRQARLPSRNTQPARLKFDRPFLYFVRHNPTGMILYVGRYNPRLLP